MEKTIGVLADYVSMSTEGKLHVLGVFSKIVAPQVPALHPSMTIVLQVLYGLSEVGWTTFEVDLVHDHGELLRKEPVELELPPPTGGTLGILNLLHRFVGTVFEWYGLYEFRLSLGKEKTSLQFRLRSLRRRIRHEQRREASHSDASFEGELGQDDLHTVLTAFGFELTEGGNHRLYEHPLLPDWHVTIARHKPLAKGYVVAAIKAIDALQAKQRKESNRGE